MAKISTQESKLISKSSLLSTTHEMSLSGFVYNYADYCLTKYSIPIYKVVTYVPVQKYQTAKFPSTWIWYKNYRNGL